MDTLTASQILPGLSLLCAGVVIAMLRNQNAKGSKTDVALQRIETLLTGANGDNGLVGDVKQLRERTHAIANDVNAVKGRQDLQGMRMDEWDRRHGPEDRRAAS